MEITFAAKTFNTHERERETKGRREKKERGKPGTLI